MSQDDAIKINHESNQKSQDYIMMFKVYPRIDFSNFIVEMKEITK